MLDLEILNELIAKTARVAIMDHHGTGRIELTEPDCPDSKVSIYGLPMDAVVVKTDCFPAPDAVFKGSRGECKRADFAIIAGKNQRTVVLYLEMKRTKAPFNEIIKQLTGARCFMQYCAEIGKSFWNERDFMRSVEHRFVSIGHSSIAKRPTRPHTDRPADRNDKPERALKIDWPHYLQFNRLTGTIP